MALLRRSLLSCVAALILASPPAGAQPPALSAQQYQAKAAFLYNFAKFVDWPVPEGDPEAPIVIVILGGDPIGQALDQAVWGKKVNGRPLRVRRISLLRDVLPAHLVFVSAQERRRGPELIRAVEGAGVLTVGEADDFLEQGGAVRFIAEDNKARFVINLEAVRRSGLMVSSRLLSLARVERH
jgi:hypothetical protein